MSATRIVSVRLPEEQFADLATIAKFDGVALAELMRAGVDLLLEERRSDPEFRKRVEQAYAEAQRLLADVPGAGDVLDVLSRPLTEHPTKTDIASAGQAAIDASVRESHTSR